MHKEILLKIKQFWLDYLLLFLSLIIIFGTSVYYFYQLNTLGIIISISLSAITFYILHNKLSCYPIKKIKVNKTTLPLSISYLILFILSIFILFSNSSSSPLISPWEVLNNWFFIIYTLTTLSLIIIISKKKIDDRLKLFYISLHYFLSFSIAAIIYKIAYGFDPLIHQSSMEFINDFGFIKPKTPYYIGEYSLIIFLHKISALSIQIINKFLVPVISAIFIPREIYYYLKQKFPNHQKNNFLSLIILLTLSFSPFIMTTPQSLSYVFLIITIFSALGRKNILWPIIFALSTTAIHPLSGIPALIFVTYIVLKDHSNVNKKVFNTAFFIVSSLSLPLVFLFSAHNHLRWNTLSNIFNPLFSNLNIPGQENFVLNFIYLFNNNIPLIILILIIISIIIYYKNHIFKYPAGLLMISSLSFSYLISANIKFGDLITYEQNSYPQRILKLIVIFSLPYIVILFNIIIQRILKHKKELQIICLVITLLILSTSLYISYPRRDKYYNTKGYSVSQDDLDAVRWIDNNSHDNYIVLANQQLGVAALKELGFKHYYSTKQGLIYFYSIPTGGPLYKYYLDMVYKSPSNRIARRAMDLTKTKTLYLVVSKYWFQSDRIIGEAKLVANSFKQIKNDYIFKYQY